MGDYDPGRVLEVRLVDRCLDLGAKLAALERREMTEDDVRVAREAITTTPSGKPMRVIKGASETWIEASLRQADEFEAGLFDNDVDLIDLPAEDANPPPEADE